MSGTKMSVNPFEVILESHHHCCNPFHQSLRLMWTFVSLFAVLCNVLLAFAAKDIFDAVATSDISAIEKTLSENKQQLNKKGPGGQTPLMNAVLSGKTSIVEFLLKAGADVTIPEQDGYTPMVSQIA